MLDRWMTKLAYSRLMTEAFQRVHLIVNYMLLGVALVIYLLLGGNDEWIITASCIPGATIFIVSIWGYSYRSAIERNDDFMDLINSMMR